MLLSDFNFGEYDGRQEWLREEQYFLDSFIEPPNLNINNVSKNKKFVIIGHKGVGKSSFQLNLELSKSKSGYKTGFLSFYDDLSPNDYLEFSKTQKISFVEIANSRDVTGLYDFREIWKRILLKKIADLLSVDGPTRFTKFMQRSHSGTRSLVDSIVSGLKIKADFSAIFADVGIEYDATNLVGGGEINLADFNDVALGLLVDGHKDAKIFFSIDELIVSNFETRSDEYKVRIAIIRDAVKVANVLNNKFVEKSIDINIICSLRPEVRDTIYKIDGDISKAIDSCYMSLDWDANENEDHPLLELMYNKVKFGAPGGISIDDAKNLFVGNVEFSKEAISIPIFILSQSWHRPRDIVRFLKCYAQKNPKATQFDNVGVKRMLDEYSRVSAIECFNEISVKYNASVTDKLRDLIRYRSYKSYDNFVDALSVIRDRIDVDELSKDLYNAGVIYNVDYVDGKPRFFTAHRGNDFLYKDMGISVHHGLWNYFGIRHKAD